MTVAIPEAAGAVEARAGGTAARRKVVRGEVVSRRPQWRPGEVRGETRASPPPRNRRAAPTVTYTPRNRGGSLNPVSGNSYQGVILAEFLGAVLIVAFLPLAAGAPNDGKTGPSPYRVNDIEQLAAIGITYFLLALLANGNHGRIAAWFGGLILLGIAFKKLASGQFSAAVSGIGGKPVPAEAGDYAGGGGGGGKVETQAEES